MTVGALVAVAEGKLSAAGGGLLFTIVGVPVNDAISDSVEEAVAEDRCSVFPAGNCTDEEHAPLSIRMATRRRAIELWWGTSLGLNIACCLLCP